MMNVDIHVQNVELNPSLREFIEEKMADVEHAMANMGVLSARVEVGIPSQHHNSGQIFYAEANIQAPGRLFRAETTHHDLHAAIVEVKDDLKNQISRFKEKLREEQRQPSRE